MRLRINQSPLKIERRFVKFEALLLALVLALTVTTGYLKADTGTCSGQTITLPFTDVMGNSLFCSIAQVYFQGITLGVTPTTYDPTGNVRRDQMAAFLARTQNSVLNRGSRRSALNQWAPPTAIPSTALTTIGTHPELVQSDGADLWVANVTSGSVSRVRASDGKLLETWTGATGAFAVLVARGRIWVTGNTTPGKLYSIDPTQPAGPVTVVLPSTGGNVAVGITTDGTSIWIANVNGSVSKYDPETALLQNFSGFGNPRGLLYDGANVWMTDNFAGTLLRLNPNGTVAQTVTVGNFPQWPVFDGTNIWVPCGNGLSGHSVTVVRPTDGMVLATLTGNGLNNPRVAAFDGQRVLVTNQDGNSVSLWRAADFAPLGFISTGASSTPVGACSDGVNFWIALDGTHKLARF